MTIFRLAAIALFTAVAASPAQDAQKLTVGEFTFSATAGWKAKPQPRTMSKGGFTHSAEAGGLVAFDADFYHFGKGQGGTVDANVQRWKSQFKAGSTSTSEELKFGDRSATLLTVKGAFLQGRPFGPKTERPGYALLGAILPSPEGPVFIKATGPEKSILAALDAFKKLVASAYE